jgi:hypothetical protein
MRLFLAIAFVAVLPSLAYAGGNEFPGNGTEALGRGAAFTAKASDATAFDYNVAGFATQRGTRLTLNANLVWNDYTFQRFGNDPNNNNMPYPQVRNSGGLFFAPYFGLSTDFEKLDRWTFAVGIFGPSSVGNRTFPEKINDIAAPNRYDITKLNLLLFFPTFAAAVRATHWMDIGAQLQVVYGTFDLSNVANVPLQGVCLSHGTQYSPCDAKTEIQANGLSATAALGFMFHVQRFLDIGVHVRGPVNLHTSGTVTPTIDVDKAPAIIKQQMLKTAPATFDTKLPWVVRLGLRYIFRSKRDNFEHGDIEVDGVYEAWQAAEGNGDQVSIPLLGLFTNINPTITHNYRDTFSARLGGSWNARLPVGVFTLRLGGYYESAATKYADTRLDFDTMAKVAGTAGLGYRVRGIALNVGYAYIWEPDRIVNNGDIRLINGQTGFFTEDPNNSPTPVVNNGQYHASNQILSLGLSIAWEELVGRRRFVHWE